MLKSDAVNNTAYKIHSTKSLVFKEYLGKNRLDAYCRRIIASTKKHNK